MYTRSELRYACFRAQKNSDDESLKPLLDAITKKLKIHQKMSNFKVVWDLLVDKNGEISIIEPEHDINFIHATCLEYSVLVKNNLEPTNFTDRQNNIITIVDMNMLEGKMDWSNYSSSWGVELDNDTKMIKTRLYNVPSNQIVVTEEMIQNSMKSDGSEFTPERDSSGLTVQLEPKEPSIEEKMMLDALVTKSKKKKS